VTGTVVRPIFDGLKISREKLAYICDSTSAPICALIPVNAWGAYMAGLLARQGVEKPLLVYFKAIPFNYYAWAAILLVLFLTLSRKDFFSMKRAEQRAREKGQVLRPGSIPLVSHEVTNLEPKQGVRPRASNMVIPLAVMIVMMVAGLLITGRGDLANGSGSTAVLWAVLAALAAGGLLYWARGVMGPGELTGLFFKGVGGLVPIATLMMLAFALGQLCRDLNTGLYVAELVKNMLVPSLVPVVLFVTTGFIAFATGTSWGTWAVMVPIGLPLALQMGINPVLAVAAITSGGVFGDHCSPISDTTLVSSMASASDHMDHVNTQLPYALTAGLVAAVFFLLAGVTM